MMIHDDGKFTLERVDEREEGCELKNQPMVCILLSAQHLDMTCNTGKFKWSDATPIWQSVRSLSPTAGYFESSLC